MATRYSQDIKTNINELTIETVRCLYEWIAHCVKEYNACVVPEFEVRYERGEVSCTTDDYNEFIRDTYGLPIEINDVRIYYHDIHLSFFIDYRYDIHVHNRYVKIMVFSDDIDSISTIVPSLRRIIVAGKIAISRSIQQLPEITVNIGGDLNMNGNAIGNNNAVENKGANASTITTKTEIQQEKLSFWEGVWQQIVASWIWWLLGVIGVTILIIFRSSINIDIL